MISSAERETIANRVARNVTTQRGSYDTALRAARAAIQAVQAEPHAVVEFARWAIQNSAFAGGDLCGGEVQDKAEALGLLNRVPFDPKIHSNLEHTFAPGERLFVFSDLLSSSPALPPAGGKGAASLRDAAPTQFAYLAIHDGECTEICAEEPRGGLLRFVEFAIESGGYVVRVPLEVARGALYHPWPPVSGASPSLSAEGE